MSESLNPQAAFEASLGPAMIKEGQCREYKTSIFMAPGEKMLGGAKQMKTIADTLAAFMNAEGGLLFIGVTDDYKTVGIKSDLQHLEYSASSLVLKTSRMNDADHTYKGTVDSYELKIRAIVRAFLSENASALLSKVEFRNMQETGMPVCCVSCRPCKPGDWVYSYDSRYNPKKQAYEETPEIYVRFGNQKRLLKGIERDQFIRDRVEQGFASQLELMKSKGNMAEVMDSVQEMLARLKGRHIAGAEVTVSGAVPFTQEALEAATKPKTLVWDGKHYTDVSNWKDLVLKVLLKMQEVNPAAFDQMAEEKTFRRHLVKVLKPRERHSDCFTEKFGTEGKVRIKTSLGNKTYLYREDYILRKMLSFAQIDASRFMFTAE